MHALYIIEIALVVAILYNAIVVFFQKLGKDGSHLSLIHVLFLRLIGSVLFILASYLLIVITDYDFHNTVEIFWSSLFIILFIPAIISVNAALSKKPAHNEKYPQLNTKRWGWGIVLINALSWAVYLFSYELFFRGILLFCSIHVFGITLAIVFNAIVYSMAHLSKGKFEAIGSIPLGVVFCIMAYLSGSFLVVWMLHMVMAISNDLFCIYYSSEKFYQLKRR